MAFTTSSRTLTLLLALGCSATDDDGAADPDDGAGSGGNATTDADSSPDPAPDPSAEPATSTDDGADPPGESGDDAADDDDATASDDGGGATTTGEPSGSTSDAADSGDTDPNATDSGGNDDAPGTGSFGSGSEDGNDDFGESGNAVYEVSGVVIAGVAPAGDGVGTLYVAVTASIDCFDGDPPWSDVIAQADMSEIGNSVAFNIPVEIEFPGSPGDYILQVFLDDDNNSTYQDPDPGDMAVYPTGFEEAAGCIDLGDIDGDLTDLVVELDHIVTN